MSLLEAMLIESEQQIEVKERKIGELERQMQVTYAREDAAKANGTGDRRRSASF